MNPISPPVDGTPPTVARKRADACTVVGTFVVLLALIPARLVFSGLPLDVRPCMLIGLGIGLLWLCAHFVHSSGMAKGRSWVRIAIYVFATTQIATYGYATAQYLPPDELKSADRSFITILSFLAVGLLVCDGIRSVKRLETLVRVVVVAVGAISVVGLMQFFTGFDLAGYLVLPGLRAVGSTDFVLARDAFRRPAGTTGHPIEFGIVCALAVPLAAHFALLAGRRSQPAARWWLLLAIIAVGAVVSLSRSAILGLLAAAIVLLPTWPARRRWTAVGVVIGFFSVLWALVPGLVGTLASLFENVSNDPSIQGRTDDYATTSASIDQHWWWGRGFGTYLPSKYSPIDNQYLGTIVENGMIGLAALIFLFLSAVIAVVVIRRNTKDPAVRDLAQSLMASVVIVGVASATFDTFAFSIVTGLMFVLLGVCGALRRCVGSRRSAA